MSTQAEDFFRVRTVGLKSQDLDAKSIAQALANEFKVDLKAAAAIIKGRVVAKKTSQGKARSLKTKLFNLGVVAKIEKSDAELPKQDKDDEGIAEFIDQLNEQPVAVTRDTQYKLWASAMLLTAGILPLLYIALVGAIIYGSYFYATEVPMRVSFSGLILWTVPLLTALVMVIFLLRPCFIRAPKLTRIPIQASQAPLLFKMIDKICTATQTPQPQNVYVCSDVNAYVASASGFTGSLKKELDLTIGMPLLYGLNLGQLASVVAHEFGHFTQSFDIFTSTVVNTVNRWLSTCAYYKDPLEVKLEQAQQQSEDLFVRLALYVPLGCIRGTRFVFQYILLLNARITGRLSQHMEFNADDYAVQLTGSKSFVDSSIRLRELSYASQWAWHNNWAAYDENRLYENFPHAVAELQQSLDKETKRDIIDSISEETTRYWDSHPADTARNERAEAQNVPEVAGSQGACLGLVRDATKLAGQVTLQMYSRDYGLPDANDCAVNNQVVHEISQQREDGQQAAQTLLGNLYDGRFCRFATQPQQIDEPAAPNATLELYWAKKTEVDRLFVASLQSRSGEPLAAGSWGIEDHSLANLEELLGKAEAEFRSLQSKVRDIDSFIQTRLLTEMSNIATDNKARAEYLYQWLIDSSKWVDAQDTMWRCAFVLHELVDSLSQQEGSQALAKQVELYRQHCVGEYAALLNRVKDLNNPQRTHEGTANFATLGEFLGSWHVTELNQEVNAADLLHQVQQLTKALRFAFHQTLNELAGYCVGSKAN